MSFAFCLSMEKSVYVIFKILLHFIVAKRSTSFEKELSNLQQMFDKYVHLHYTIHRCQSWTYTQLIQPLGQTRCELNVTHVAFNVLTHFSLSFSLVALLMRETDDCCVQ